MEIIEDLCNQYKWPHDFWRRMGWNELQRWIALLDQRKYGKPTDPGSWDGADQDPWWQQARQKRADARGR